MTLTYVWGSMRLTLSNPRFVLFTIALPVILYLTIGATQTGDIAGTPAAAYFMVNLAMYGAAAATVNTGARIAVDRQAGWLRQLRLTPLSPRDYVLGRAGLSLLLALPSLVLVCLIAQTLGGVDLPLATTAQFVGSALLGLIAFAALGVAIGYAASGDTVQAVVGIVFNVLAILGGTWWPVADDGGLMAAIARLTPSYWANVLARAPITDESMTVGGVLVLVAWTVGLLAFAARRYRADAARA